MLGIINLGKNYIGGRRNHKSFAMVFGLYVTSFELHQGLSVVALAVTLCQNGSMVWRQVN